MEMIALYRGKTIFGVTDYKEEKYCSYKIEDLIKRFEKVFNYVNSNFSLHVSLRENTYICINMEYTEEQKDIRNRMYNVRVYNNLHCCNDYNLTKRKTKKYILEIIKRGEVFNYA